MTAFLLGAVELYGEVVLFDDPGDIKAEEVAYAAAFPTIASKSMLVCAAAALNHYAINHTTGQGRLQGFALKVARVLGLKYPMGKDTASREIREAATRAFYAAGHPVSKRNMMFVLDPDITGVSAAWTPGMPHPATTVSDDFVRLRIGGFPAGVRKLYVTKEACKRIAACGLLVAMPHAQDLKVLNASLDEAAEVGVGAHVGSTYYTRHTQHPTKRIDQTSDIMQTLTMCAGAFLHIVAPASTLAQSPAFTSAIQEASLSHPDWIVECRIYAEAFANKKAKRIATILGSEVSKKVCSDTLASLLEAYETTEDPGVQANLAARVAQESRNISAELLEARIILEDEEADK